MSRLSTNYAALANGAMLRTSAYHTVVLKSDVLVIKLVDCSARALQRCRYELELGDRTFRGATEDGRIRVKVRLERRGLLQVWTDPTAETPDFVATIQVTDFGCEPPVAASRARLLNLGFGHDVASDEGQRGAIETFQDLHDLNVTGTIDDVTVAKIKAIHGA